MQPSSRCFTPTKIGSKADPDTRIDRLVQLIVDEKGRLKILAGGAKHDGSWYYSLFSNGRTGTIAALRSATRSASPLDYSFARLSTIDSDL